MLMAGDTGYRRYLLLERGLSQTTADSYEPRARRFLSGREGLEDLGLDRLRAADVSDFLARELPLLGPGEAKLQIVVVRSVLRYLHLAGLIPAPLEWAVPAVAAVRDRSLPRGLEPSVVAALLSSCDRRRTVGRRNYAILLLLVRLGLRKSTDDEGSQKLRFLMRQQRIDLLSRGAPRSIDSRNREAGEHAGNQRCRQGRRMRGLK